MLHFKFGHAPWKLDPWKTGKTARKAQKPPPSCSVDPKAYRVEVRRRVGLQPAGTGFLVPAVTGLFSCRPLQGCWTCAAAQPVNNYNASTICHHVPPRCATPRERGTAVLAELL